VVSVGVKPKLANSWISVELFGRLKDGEIIENSKVSAKKLSELTICIQNGDVSAKASKDVLDYLFENDGDESVNSIIEKLGLKQINDNSLIIDMIEDVIKNNSDKVAEYKNGKVKLLGFFVGQVLKASKGSANPQMVNKLMDEYLAK
jgi:aspartyl-tRNA(Asn)/glutamyl-tRNA(Gln) amidotransferase subunit B